MRRFKMSSSRLTIFLVDDNPTILTAGKNMLMTFYQVIPLPSAAAMFEAIEDLLPDLILLDIEMPDMDGYKAIQKLKSEERWQDIPVIFITAKEDAESEVDGFDLGAVDYIKKPFSAPLMLKRIEKELSFVEQKRQLIEAQAELKHHLDNLEEIIQNKADAVIHLQNAVFDTVVDLVEIRDRYTGDHVIRTQRYLKTLLDEMQREGVYSEIINDWDMMKIMIASKLYDIGKILVPSTILSKGGKLSDEEFERVKAHVQAGSDAIERIMKEKSDDDFFNHAIRMAGTHHENWDGSGYPIGLRGNNIPLEGRLIALSGAYDALVSERYHKTALSHEEACHVLKESAGKQFDPVLVGIFLNVEDQFKQISES